MSFEEYLRTILDDEEIEMICAEPAFTFNLEIYEDPNNE
jgi:hypothetical protein